MCLMLKLLQLQPEKEIIVEFIRNEDYKYVRILGEVCLTSHGNSRTRLSRFLVPYIL